jgi:hypothetical protein
MIVRSDQLKHFLCSWFKTFTAFWMLYALFWVIPRCLNFKCQCFGTLSLFRNFGVWNSDVGESPRRKHTTLLMLFGPTINNTGTALLATYHINTRFTYMLQYIILSTNVFITSYKHLLISFHDSDIVDTSYIIQGGSNMTGTDNT